MSTNIISNRLYESSHKSIHRRRITYSRHRSGTTSSSDDQAFEQNRSKRYRKRNCGRSSDRFENCDRRLESGVNGRHRSCRSRNRDRHHITSRSRSCRHYCHRRVHRSRSCSNECHGSRRSRSSKRRGFTYARNNSTTSSSDCRTSQKWMSTENGRSSPIRSSRTKTRGRRGRRSYRYQQSSRSESSCRSSSRAHSSRRSKNCDGIHGRRNRRCTCTGQPHSHQQSYRSESCCGGSCNAHMSRPSTNGDGLGITCNGDRSRADLYGDQLPMLQKSISICEKSTQTDNTVDYTGQPTYQDASTGNDYTHVLPDLNDYDVFLNDYDPLFVDSFLNPPVARDDNQLECKNTNASSNFDDADNSNQTVAETLVQQSQPAVGIGENKDKEKNKADGANQQLKMFCRVEMTRIPHDKKHLQKVIQIHKVKNINPEWHSLSEKMDCKICGICFNRQVDLVKHFVIVHPTAEVFPSRVAPDVARRLRSSKPVHQCKRFKTDRFKFEQFCYFCNQMKILTKWDWSNHLASHSGCFEFTSYRTASEIGPRFENFNVRAFLCDFCNYVRFSKTDMENHLKNEHGRDATNVFKEVIFLRFLRHEDDHWRMAGQFNGRVNWFKYTKIDEVPCRPVAVKNNNPDWHCLNQANGCIICGSGDSAAFHYVNVHPNAEVIISRLEPSVANFLRSLKYFAQCKIVDGGGRRHFAQNCFFCNELKVMRKHDWIDHMISHTGYYRRQCSSCLKMLRRSDCLACKAKGTITDSVHLFEGRNLIGYLCDLCNFIRFDKKEMEKHLRNEHDGNNGFNDYEEIVFLTFPDHGKRRCFMANQSVSIVVDEPLPEIKELIAETNDEPLPEIEEMIAETNVPSAENSGGEITSLMQPGAATGELID